MLSLLLSFDSSFLSCSIEFVSNEHFREFFFFFSLYAYCMS